jgi:hypothetical protein
MHGKELEARKLAATQAFVTKQFVLNKKAGVEQVTEETLAVHRFATEPAKIEVSLGLTLNLGNYESARLSVGMTVPCYKEESDDAFNWAKDWISERLKVEVKNIRDKSDTSII